MVAALLDSCETAWSGVEALRSARAQLVEATGKHRAFREPCACGPRLLVARTLGDTVLVVDDEMAGLIRHHLERDGHTVVEAQTLLGAIQEARRADIGAVVLDWRLREKTAEPLARSLTEEGVPVLLISGYADREMTDLAEKLGLPILEKSGDASFADGLRVWARIQQAQRARAAP